MDTSDAAATDAPYFHDSDDEEVGFVERNHFQRAAHKQTLTKLENPREVKRLKAAVVTKAAKEAAAAAAKPALFDLWATTLEEDLKAGIVPAADERGFRVGRTVQSRFRHGGAARGKEHLTASVLPQQIDSGVSFHPDEEARQALLRKAYEKDEAERAELRRIQARFQVKPTPEAEEAAAAAAAAAAADDSWMDESDPVKGPSTTSAKLSKTQRNKLARAAENRAKVAAVASEKELGKLVNRIPVMMAEMKKAEKLAAKERARVAELKETQPDRKPKLGRYEEQEQFPDFVLTEELPVDGSMRTVKPSTHVVEDQFARFQSRHLIETRKRVKKTKRTIKGRSYERYKDYEASPAVVAAQ